MAKKSIRERLEKLESERRFLEWFVLDRFLTTLTVEELETWASCGGLPDPLPNRPSSLDTLDRKSLRRLWEEHNQIFESRSQQEKEFCIDNGFFPEQRGRLHYFFMQNGQLQVEGGAKYCRRTLERRTKSQTVQVEQPEKELFTKVDALSESGPFEWAD